ncbi:MAG: hypothetical protein ABI852_01720 [Gemmatimonadaceae bacterium]
MNFLAPPDGVVINSLVMLAVIVAVPIYFVVRFLRAYERRTRMRDVGESKDQQLEAMRDTIERLEREVQRLSEAQQFTTQLLSQDKTQTEVAPIVRRS